METNIFCRSNLEGQEAELWHEDLIEAAEVGRRHVMEVKTASFALAVLNMSLLQRNFEHAFETLQVWSLTRSFFRM